ncbi:MAG: DUF937 domain-containing protein, partial [Flavobacteriales bacterium]|nr:DUF937 domain-containing protein [Flavobacteriales bacterium]
MNNLVDTLLSEFQGNTTRGISQQIGATEAQTQNALNQFLPIMVQALSKNSQTTQGAASLFNAVSNDHDGSILNDVMGFLGNSSSGPGKGILGHVFSSQLSGVNGFISESTGLSPQMTSTLMEVAAPLVM